MVLATIVVLVVLPIAGAAYFLFTEGRQRPVRTREIKTHLMRIVLATDGSIDAQATGEVLRTWRFREIIALSVVTVVPTDPPFAGELQLAESTAAHPLSDCALRIAEDAAHALAAVGLPAQVQSPGGHPADQILRVAEADEANLILLGARGAGRSRRFALGAVADRVSRHARCSVLVVRAPVRPLQSILVATDGSPAATDALNALMTVVQTDGVRAHVVFVLPPLDRTLYSFNPLIYQRLRLQLDDIQRQEAATATDASRQAAERLIDHSLVVTREVRNGDPATEIIAAAHEHDADLIVVGAHGRHSTGLAQLGCVGQAVVREATCSVLIGHRLPGSAAHPAA